MPLSQHHKILGSYPHIRIIAICTIQFARKLENHIACIYVDILSCEYHPPTSNFEKEAVLCRESVKVRR